MRLKSLAALLIAMAALVFLPAAARAQSYPERPVRILIAFSPAGAIDILGRLIADKLSAMWGQQVVVENRPGGGGNIGAAAAAAAPPVRRADARHQRHAVADHRVPSGHEL
jgi:tripartite-type tricarboxylate transporter receptor subunit TctC